MHRWAEKERDNDFELAIKGGSSMGGLIIYKPVGRGPY